MRKGNDETNAYATLVGGGSTLSPSVFKINHCMPFVLFFFKICIMHAGEGGGPEKLINLYPCIGNFFTFVLFWYIVYNCNSRILLIVCFFRLTPSCEKQNDLWCKRLNQLMIQTKINRNLVILSNVCGKRVTPKNLSNYVIRVMYTVYIASFVS